MHVLVVIDMVADRKRWTVHSNQQRLNEIPAAYSQASHRPIDCSIALLWQGSSSSSKAAPQQAVDFIRASMRVDLGSMSSAPCSFGQDFVML